MDDRPSKELDTRAREAIARRVSALKPEDLEFKDVWEGYDLLLYNIIKEDHPLYRGTLAYKLEPEDKHEIAERPSEAAIQ